MRSHLARQAPRDAVEHVRRELLELLDYELQRLRRAARKGAPINGETLRQLGRAARELGALPGPQGEPAAVPAPEGKRAGLVNTRGGLAGKIRAAAAPRPLPVPADAPPPTSEQGIYPGAGELEPAPAREEEEGEPGLYARRQIAALRGELEPTRVPSSSP